eukprot:gene22164-45766_t
MLPAKKAKREPQPEDFTVGMRAAAAAHGVHALSGMPELNGEVGKVSGFKLPDRVLVWLHHALKPANLRPPPPPGR